MREPTDRKLYDRGAATLLAAWAACATVADGAALVRHPGVAAAVFPSGPERDVYNNALLGRDLADGEREAAVDAMEEAYAAAGVTGFAAWAHESDRPLVRELERRGYRLAESTRAMGMALDGAGDGDGDGAGAGAGAADAEPEPGALDLAEPAWAEHVRLIGVAPGFLGAGPPGFHVLVARHDGAIAATGLAFDHDGDCGIYNVGTVAAARRRGLGTAVTAHQLRAARARGCTSASIQSTPMAERVYAAVGFRDLGRFLEYVR
jgi:GNAT superfamily N-acetyltransferase